MLSPLSLVQRLMVAQNRRIDQLVEKITQQQDKLDKQNLHLQALQNKVRHHEQTHIFVSSNGQGNASNLS